MSEINSALRSPLGEPSRPGLADVRLMALVASGDVRARHMCAMRLVSRFRRIAAAILSKSCDVDDAIQESLIAVFEAASGFRGDGRMEGWAAKIAARRCIELARRHRKHQARLEGSIDPDGLGLDYPHAPTSIDERSSVDEALPRPLRDYLDGLPEPERVALVLRHGLGHTLDEIAELTGTSASTAKYRIRNALTHARASIRRDELVRGHTIPDHSSTPTPPRRPR